MISRDGMEVVPGFTWQDANLGQSTIVWMVGCEMTLQHIMMSAMSVVACNAVLQVEIGVPGFVFPSSNVALAYHTPAFEAAVESCNHVFSDHLNFTLEIFTGPETVRDGPSFRMISADLVAQWYYRKRLFPTDVSVIITPGQLDSTNVHQLTANWNMLYFSTYSYTRSQYILGGTPAVSTAYLSIPAIAAAVVRVMKFHGWSSLYMVIDSTSQPVYSLVGQEISFLENQPRLTIVRRIVFARALGSFEDILTEFRNLSRILIFLGHTNQIRRFLIEANSRNMTDGTFVYMCMGPGSLSDSYPSVGNLSWQFHDLHDEDARHGFQSLLVIQPMDSVDTASSFFRDLGTAFRRRAEVLYNTSYTANDQPMTDIISDYCTIKMYCQAVNQSLYSEGPHFLRNGRVFSEKFLNTTYQNDFCDIYVGRDGVRHVALGVFHFDDRDRRSQEVFLVESKEHNFELQLLKNISSTWPGYIWPPPNEPYCGYDGHKLTCQLASGSVFVTAFATTASLFGITSALILSGWYVRAKAATVWWG